MAGPLFARASRWIVPPLHKWEFLEDWDLVYFSFLSTLGPRQCLATANAE